MTTDEQPARTGESILVIRLSSLGDILLAEPAIRALRKRFPTAHIDFLVAREFKAAADLISGYDRVLTFDRNRGFNELRVFLRQYFRCYDIVVDLQNSLRSSLLRTLLFPTLWVKAQRYRIRRWFTIRLKWDLYRERIPVRRRYLKAVEMLGGEVYDDRVQLRAPEGNETVEQEDRLVVLCPGAKHFTKRWPVERWAELGELLAQDDCRIIVAGDTNEDRLVAGLVDTIERADSFVGQSLSEVALLLRRAELVITNDSGLMHLASGVGTPIVAIFGPTIEHFGFFPSPEESIVIENELVCRPCSAFGGASCPKGHFRCMLDTSAQRVYTAAKSFLQAKPPKSN